MSVSAPPIAIEPAVFDEHQAAQFLNLSVHTLRKWRSIDNGPRFVRFGAAVRYRKNDLDRYMENPGKYGMKSRGR